MQIDLGTSARFRVTAKNTLRDYQIRGGQLADVLKDLSDMAASEQIDLALDAQQAKQATYTIDGPFDSDAKAVVAEVTDAWKAWEAAGRPAIV